MLFSILINDYMKFSIIFHDENGIISRGFSIKPTFVGYIFTRFFKKKSLSSEFLLKSDTLLLLINGKWFVRVYSLKHGVISEF